MGPTQLWDSRLRKLMYICKLLRVYAGFEWQKWKMGQGGRGGPNNPKQLPRAMNNIPTRHRVETFHLEAG